jgi:hypothetical protein
MKSDGVRLVSAFLTGCFFVSLLFFCFLQPSEDSSYEIKHSIEYSTAGDAAENFEFKGIHQPSVDPAFNLKLDPNKKLVILLSAFRSGSTFLGNLFDSNPTMQYMFEPFYSGHVRKLRNRGAILGARPDHTESDLRMLYLQQMLHNCTVYLTPFPEKFEWCGTEEEHLHRFNSTKCDRKYLKTHLSQQEICRYRNITVIKVIRLLDLSDILKIAQIRSADVKIIQLLRHPVPMMMSRRSGGKFFMWDDRIHLEPEPIATGDVTQRRTKLAWEAFDYCHSQLKAIELIENNPWLKDRYLRVTHYDMSLRPLETAEKVYSFIGVTLTDHIKEYIRNITGAESEDFKNASEEDALNVFKNSTEIVTKWKKLISVTLKFWDVFSVEAQCKRMFEPLRHEFTVDSIADLKLLEVNSALDDLYDNIDHEETDEPLPIDSD